MKLVVVAKILQEGLSFLDKRFMQVENKWMYYAKDWPDML